MIYGRELLIYASIINKGDWLEIYKFILEKPQISEAALTQVMGCIKCGVITILDQNYPEYLKKIERPPFVLFYYGDISLLDNYEKNLSIVGSRDVDDYIVEPTKELVMQLSCHYTIVSGLARGIDTIAHESALKVGGKTIAVLANGIDYCYPLENIEMCEIIKKKGLVISEYPFDTQPKPTNFPFRNRIIAGLSKGIFIPSIMFASGTYSTLSYAIKFGREVFILPHKPFSVTANNRLINEGATLVNAPDDIIEYMG